MAREELHKKMKKIVTACKHGLVRSVGLADVLKLHFEPVDVIPVGLNSNSKETLEMLGEWCDWFIVMEQRYLLRVPEAVPQGKLMICEVGQDTYGNSHNRQLIDKVWQWARKNQRFLGIQEHQKRL